ncbi:unnamed protein product [Cylicostephanus goldi]|uniref:Rad21/Rec8-like protein C-terminal eukaryotic domain-containing protein n=1 Tax=Cylicostephanus goldi TaxID=71465 RepID=A0A3P7Q2E5_CYLGO|nr:unnamed protein product [Cylicostephanus goldi]
MAPFASGRHDKRKRKKRQLIVDEHKSISVDEMKANMADFSDTLQTLDLAPPTRRLMLLKESSLVEKLLQLPGCPSLRATPLVMLYQSHLRMQFRDTEECEIKDIHVSDDIELTYEERQEDGEKTFREVHKAVCHLKGRQNLLSVIAAKLQSANQSQIVFDDLMTRSATRKTAARRFFILLELVGLRAVNVMQQGCYHNIFISAGPNLGEVMAQ